ncbi:MAG: CRISPR-associated endonuclease Cas2 [Planctomycetia bacterium]|nr:CRISPR-associated endonuclease Cas2 [Planctomycetia bacterium]
MWLIVMFDLPTDTKAARKEYTNFRKFLLKDGFSQMQFSVYSRHVPSRENAEVHINRVKASLPPDGEVRILACTDKQFERMYIFFGNLRKTSKPTPKQLTFF